MKENGLEVSKRNYIGAADFLRVIAEQITDLKVPPEVIEKWKALFIAIRIVDHRLDNIRSPEEREQLSRSD